MSLVRDLSVLMVRQVLADRAESLLGFLGDRLNDNAQRLEKALTESSDRAWIALELALGGASMWKSITSMFTSREEQGLVRNIQTYLANLPTDALPAQGDAFRKLCLAELYAARKVGLVPGTSFSVHAVAGDVQVFARYGDRDQIIGHERRILDGMAGVLRKEGYRHLADYVGLRPGDGRPLLIQAAQHFFRRAVENDPRLAAGLTLERLDSITAGQQAGFDSLHTVLQNHGDRIETIFLDLEENSRATLELVSGTRDEVKTLQTQMDQQSEQIRQLSEMLRTMLEKQTQTPIPVAQVIPVAKVAPVAPEPPVSTPVTSPTNFSTKPTPTPAATGWDQVRTLLARAKGVTAQQSDTPPELERIVGQLTEATQKYEATRQSMLKLEPIREEISEPEILDALPADAPAPYLRSKGKMISNIFQGAKPPPADSTDELGKKDEQAEAQPAPKRKFISPLFDPKKKT